MLCFPNCKLNLGLYVTQKRADGYHDIETVFYPLPLCDVLEITPSPETKLHISGKNVAGNEADNLILKAYHLLQQRYPDTVKNLDIYLHKVIPMGAGLGGGSADGAFMLQLLNNYYQLGISKQELSRLSLLLGSDCPFFIHNSPQLASGRGELMQPVSIDLSVYSLQLICPQVHVSSAAAFGMLTPQLASYDLRQLPSLPITEWKNHIHNDFETPVFQLHPALADIKNQLYAQGAIYAAMSGSGSAIYGIFSKKNKATIISSVVFEEHYME
jgi:4-diphosphocytidyl-2-C-methyl-D-erythritol kinase